MLAVGAHVSKSIGAASRATMRCLFCEAWLIFKDQSAVVVLVSYDLYDVTGHPPLWRQYQPAADGSRELQTMVMVRLNQVTTRYDPSHYQSRANLTLIAPQGRFVQARRDAECRGAIRVWEINPPAGDRWPNSARIGGDLFRWAAHEWAVPWGSPHRHGFPELCPLSAHGRQGQHGVFLAVETTQRAGDQRQGPTHRAASWA
jgi:hypothetical protein